MALHHTGNIQVFETDCDVGPDIITMAKGLASSYEALSATAVKPTPLGVGYKFLI